MLLLVLVRPCRFDLGLWWHSEGKKGKWKWQINENENENKNKNENKKIENKMIMEEIVIIEDCHAKYTK